MHTYPTAKKQGEAIPFSPGSSHRGQQIKAPLLPPNVTLPETRVAWGKPCSWLTPPPCPVQPPHLEFHGSLVGQVCLVTRQGDDDVGTGLPL